MSALFQSMILFADNLNDHQLRTSADGLTTNDQTNIAIKGIIAIEAMSKMNSVVKLADADKYSVRVNVLDALRRN
jgi:hypothetical protein